jgi:hypothetical protein
LKQESLLDVFKIQLVQTIFHNPHLQVKAAREVIVPNLLQLHLTQEHKEIINLVGKKEIWATHGTT